MTDETRKGFLAAINSLIDEYNQLCLDFGVDQFRVTLEYKNEKPTPIPESELAGINSCLKAYEYG